MGTKEEAKKVGEKAKGEAKAEAGKKVEEKKG